MRKSKKPGKFLPDSFKPVASDPVEGIVMIFDLEGFSRFFSQPDVNHYVPRYLNKVFASVNICINGGHPAWHEDLQWRSIPGPVHWKFLGDGAMYIWRYSDFKGDDLIYFINRLWHLKNNFDRVLEVISEEVPVIDIPRRIRFGMAAGSVYGLSYTKSKQGEYIGYSINLASRLQSYCRQLGFIASARVRIPTKVLDENGYIKVVAKELNGFPHEIVIVDKKEYDSLPPENRDHLFAEHNKKPV